MAGTAEVVIIVPVLRRPRNAQRLVTSVVSSTDEGVARVLFVGSPGDDEEHAACRRTGCDLLVIDRRPATGDWARKINEAYRRTTEPYLFLGADDVLFRPGWWPAARRHLDAGAEVVGTNDLGNPRVMRGEHATHFVVARSYVDRCGTIDQRGVVLHEGYAHEMVDDEFLQTAEYRGVYAFAEDCHVEHLHPNWGKADSDPLYAAQRARMRQGRRLWLQRRHLWGR